MGVSTKIGVFAALAVATGWTQGHLAPEGSPPYDVELVPGATTARFLSLGHPVVAANLYWLQAVQYIGEPRAERRGWDKLAPLLDLVTDLDPGHGYAYQVGGILLATLGQVDAADALLEKGIRNVPNRYILPYLRAFNAFYYRGDWTEAGRFAEQAARTPGAPAHVRQNALAYYVKGRRADAAVAFLEQTLAESRDEESRKALEKQLRQARLELAAGRIDAAADEWRRRYLAGPFTPGQLVEDGLLPRLPDDPFGGAWYLDPEGRARSSASPYRFAPAEPLHQRRPEPGFQHAAGGSAP